MNEMDRDFWNDEFRHDEEKNPEGERRFLLLRMHPWVGLLEVGEGGAAGIRS